MHEAASGQQRSFTLSDSARNGWLGIADEWLNLWFYAHSDDYVIGEQIATVGLFELR